ncbi:hypothetical protein J6E39_02200 [bacterium]|nr:hypothetical protein [bacterium]
MEEILITQTSAICNLGENISEIFKNAVEGKIFPHKITAELPQIEDKNYDIRCNRILLHCLNNLNTKDLIEKYGQKRIGVIIGTTNTGIEEYETSQNLKHAQYGNPAEFVREFLGLEGIYMSPSTACTSSLKAISTAVKLLKENLCDAVIAGGVDSMASLPQKGFGALEVLTDKLTNPMSKNFTGMNIGEGGALFVIEKNALTGIKIMGIGESSDAYNAATPEPKGLQAKNAVLNALNEAGLTSEDIDYINLHGTGTESNDTMEAKVVSEIFKDKVFSSSTKPLTGHCLGAASAIEIALCTEMLSNNPEKFLLPHIYDGEAIIPEIKLAKKGEKAERLDICLSNSFGFGGTNAVIILGRKKYDLEKVLPHKHPMILIDDIVEVNLKNQYVISKVKITKDKIFFDKDGISHLAGIEFMAQTIGCYAFFKNNQNPPKIGFLLGTRLYENKLEKFEEGKTYFIKAVEIYGDNELVSFECFIYNDGVECAKAIVNAYQRLSDE